MQGPCRRSGRSGEASANAKFGADLGGDAQLKLTDTSLYAVGGYFGFRDPRSFESYLAKYRNPSATDTHAVDLSIEQKLGDGYGRLSQRIDLSPTGQSYETGIHGAMDINEDWKGIAGARLRLDEAGRSAPSPRWGSRLAASR